MKIVLKFNLWAFVFSLIKISVAQGSIQKFVGGFFEFQKEFSIESSFPSKYASAKASISLYQKRVFSV